MSTLEQHLAVLTSRYMWLSVQDLRKVRLIQLPMDKGEAPEAPLLAEELLAVVG